MSKAALVVSYPNACTTTEILPAERAVAWADMLAGDERTSSVQVIFDDLRVSTFK